MSDVETVSYRVFRHLDGTIFVLRKYGEHWAGACGPLRETNRTPFGQLSYNRGTQEHVEREYVYGHLTLLTKAPAK